MPRHAKPAAPARDPALRRSLLALALAFTASACDRPGALPAGDRDASASPNASILPAPLSTEPPELLDAGALDGGPVGLRADKQGRLILPDAGPPEPTALRTEAPLVAEAPSSRDLSGVTLTAAFRMQDLPLPPASPEVATAAIEAAARATALTWSVDLADTGRMRIAFTSRALPLPSGAEIRARADRLGTIVLWPHLAQYRVVPPGGLRTVLGERRVDVTPLAQGALRSQGDGKRLGVVVRKVELVAPLGVLQLELGKLPETGDGGPLLCRALVEVLGVDPTSKACVPGEAPLFASYRWPEGGGVVFEVTSIARRADLPSSDLLMPPPGPVFTTTGLPGSPNGIFLTREEIQAFRSAPLDLGPVTDTRAPGEGFIAANRTDALAFLLLDGVPVVAVPPMSERYVIGTARGRYVAQWRTFLGDRIEPAQPVALPARLLLGEPEPAPDAGGGG